MAIRILKRGYIQNKNHLVAMINSTNISTQHRCVLVKLRSVLFNEFIVHIPKPLGTGHKTTKAFCRMVVIAEERFELCPHPCVHGLALYKPIKVLKMQLVILLNMLHM